MGSFPETHIDPFYSVKQRYNLQTSTYNTVPTMHTYNTYRNTMLTKTTAISYKKTMLLKKTYLQGLCDTNITKFAMQYLKGLIILVPT